MPREVAVRSQPVELFKLLKFEGLVGSGGEAKFVISEGLVMLNDAVETQKRKKVVAGDVVTFNGEQLIVVVEK